MDAVARGDMDAAQRMVDEVAQVSGYTDDESWRMNHTAPMAEDDTANSIDNIDTSYGGDGSIYSPRAIQYYGEGRSYDGKAIAVIRSVRSNPEKMIRVYRAVPMNVQDSRMRNGDWVSITREYAEEHGERVLDGNYRIIENLVPAKHIYGDGNSIHEWGHDNGDRSEVYKNARGNVKKLDVTYDDNGELIPISKRFDDSNADPRYSIPFGFSMGGLVDTAQERRTTLNRASVDTQAKILMERAGAKGPRRELTHLLAAFYEYIALIREEVRGNSEKVKIPVLSYEDFWWEKVDSNHRSQ